MKMVIDTNVIIRLLTGDDIEQSPVAIELFMKVEKNRIQFVVYPLVVFECVYVLKNRYGYAKKQIAEGLLNLFDVECIEVEYLDVVKKALEVYAERNVDIADAFLASLANNQGLPIVTWNNKHFRRLDCEFYTPEEIVSAK